MTTKSESIGVCARCDEMRHIVSFVNMLCGPCSASFRRYKRDKALPDLSVAGFIAQCPARKGLREAQGRSRQSNPDPRELIPGFIIASQAMEYVAKQIQKVALTKAAVLLSGETGTGKELVAQAIHELSLRRTQPFVVVNCANLERGVAGSELFGHVRGAFSDARTTTFGLFGAAHTGTIFLNEVHALDGGVQSKLLCVLDRGEYLQVGSTTPRHVDVRVIAATNQSLPTLIAQGSFRLDLFHRLNVFPIEVPPLRERREELPFLVRHILERFGAVSTRLSADAFECLERHDWLGNVRELENVLTRAIIMKDADRDIVFPRDLPRELRPTMIARVA